MTKRLSKKQSAFVQKYAETGNATEAAFVACETSRDVAHHMGSQNLTKPDIRQEIERLLRKRNIGPERWADVTDDALAAESQRSPDHGTRLKAMDISARLADAYPRDESRHEHEHRRLHVQLTEQIEVLRFKVLHGRAPTERELRELMLPTPSSQDSGG